MQLWLAGRDFQTVKVRFSVKSRAVILMALQAEVSSGTLTVCVDGRSQVLIVGKNVFASASEAARFSSSA